MQSLYDYQTTTLLLADYAIKLHNGDDTTEIVSQLNQEIKNLVETDNLVLDEEISIELFEILFAYFKWKVSVVTTLNEFEELNIRFVSEYNKLFGVTTYCDTEPFSNYLKFLYDKPVENDHVAKYFYKMMQQFKDISFVKTKQYVLTFCVRVMLRLNMLQNNMYSPLIKEVVTILKSMPTDIDFEHTHPTFLD